MHSHLKVFVWFTAVLSALYIAGFFLLYPLMATYTVGEQPRQAIAESAVWLNESLYIPVVQSLGSEHSVFQLWQFSNMYWCNKIHGEESCLNT